MYTGHQAAVLASLNTLISLAKTNWPEYTSSGPTQDVDSALDRILNAWHEAQLDVASAVAALKVERNATTGPGSLPVELLRKVFSSLQDDWRALLALSQTCIRRREVAVPDAELWTHLDMRTVPRPVARLFKERSGDRGLSVRLPINLRTRAQIGSSAYWSDLFCAHEAHRIRRFDVTIPRSLATMSVPPAVLDAAWITEADVPLLEELAVSAPYVTALRAEDFIFRRLFAAETPRLRSLTFHGVWVPWDWGGYAGLTRLHVVLKGSRALHVHPERTLLHVFRASPALEDVRLSIPYTTHDPSIAYRAGGGSPAPVALHRARRVALELVPADLAYVLAALSLPPALPFLKLQCAALPGAVAQCLPLAASPWLAPHALSALTVDLHAREVRMMPGPDADCARSESEAGSPPVVVVAVAVAPSTSTRDSDVPVDALVAASERLRGAPFYAVYLCGSGSGAGDEDGRANADAAVLSHVLQHLPPAHTLGLKGFAPQAVAVLESALADSELEWEPGQLEFFQMRIEVDALLRLVCKSRSARRRAGVCELPMVLALLQCSVSAPEAAQASAALGRIDEFLQGRTWYKDVACIAHPGRDGEAFPPTWSDDAVGMAI